MRRGNRFLAGVLSGCLIVGSVPVSAAENPSIPSETSELGGLTFLTMKM
jgi:hypothetical protein